MARLVLFLVIMSCRSSIAAVALVLAMTSSASAQEITFAPPSSQSPVDAAATDEADTEIQWYGYQTLAADVLSWAVTLGGNEEGLVGLYFAAPLVHVLNGQPGRALGSLALRGGGTFVGMLMGSAIMDDNCEDFCIFPEGMFIGALAGLVASQLIDGFAIANKEVDRPKRWIAPTATIGNGGGTVGLAGAF